MRIKKLDGLRGIFSLMVVFFHYPSKYLPEAISNNFFIVNSDSFVDFFFVLSGFVISYNYYDLKSKNQFAIYLKKRLIRLYPLLFFTVTTIFFFNILSSIIKSAVHLFYPHIFDTYHGLNFSNHIMIPISRTIDSLLMLNSTPLMGNGEWDTGMNGPTWSISSEMISYFFFGLICIYFDKWKKIVFFTVMVISINCLFVLNEYFLTGDFGFVRGLFSFFTGSFVYMVYKLKKIILNSFFELIGLIILVFLLFMLNETRPGLHRIFPIMTPIIFGLIIYIFLGTHGMVSIILESKPAQYLGKISYSVYLNHVPLMSLVLGKVNLILSLQNNQNIQVSVFILFIIILLIISRITYLKVELKWSSYLKRKLNI